MITTAARRGKRAEGGGIVADSDVVRTALVTGAGRSVGQGIALQLAASGHRVAVNDLHDDRAAQTVELIRASGGTAMTAAFDITDRGAVEAGLKGIIDTLGPVEILVNNAGIAEGFTAGPFIESTPEQWRTQVNLNMFGSMNCVHLALPSMVERHWGRIIQISAGSASTGRNIGVSLYAGAKAGIEGTLRHVAHEVARDGITINSLALGLMENVGENFADQSDAQRALFANVPLQRFGLPVEIGAAVVWLSSEHGGYVTGQTIHLNGGSYSGR